MMPHFPSILGDVLFQNASHGVKSYDLSDRFNDEVSDPLILKRSLVSHLKKCSDRAVFIFKGINHLR